MSNVHISISATVAAILWFQSRQSYPSTDSYRQIVRDLIYEYAKYKPSHGQIETEAIVNTETDHYEVMHVGWDGQSRVHGCVVHIDIIQGKIWIQHDGTNRPVAEELLEAGVPKEDIILGFHPPQVRQYTDFGVA